MQDKKELQILEHVEMMNSIISIRDSLLNLSSAMRELLMELDSTEKHESKAMANESGFWSLKTNQSMLVIILRILCLKI